MKLVKNNRILVVGGAGYVGTALCPFLEEQGYSVDVLDVLWFGNHLPPHIRVIQKDAFDCTEDDLRSYDAVLFLAGVSTDPMAEYHPALNYVYNGALPAYVAYRAKKAGVRRFIFASSCSVYGYAIDRLYEEGELVYAQHPYGIAKYQAEKGILPLSDENFSVIALRFGTICGHSARMRMDLLINTMFHSAVSSGRILVRNPNIWRPVCHIQDALYAYICALQAPLSIQGTYNIASENITIRDAAHAVKKKVESLKSFPIEIEVKQIPDIRNYRVSLKCAKSILSFSPHYRVDDIIDDLILHRKDYDFSNTMLYDNFSRFKEIFSNSTLRVLPGYET